MADLDTAASRLGNGLRRIRQGLELQRQRILERAENSLHLPRVDGVESVVFLSGPDNDLDYYVYELGRLQDLSKETLKVFGTPPEIADALSAFNRAIPNLRKIRNPLTHPSDDDRLDAFAAFSSAVLLHPDGSVEELVDPRYEHHDAAIALADRLQGFLRTHTQTAIAEGRTHRAGDGSG